MLPSFVTIGAMKCATSTLHVYLAQHPQICMSAVKELNFFCDPATYARGPAWYASQFADDRPIAGESSPRYSKRHLVPETASRIAKLLPEARLVYLVRDPVARFVSNYIHLLSTGLEYRPLEKLLNAGDAMGEIVLNNGRYLYQLEAYLEHFPPERILVVRTEDLASDPAQTLHTVLSFLGADPALMPALSERRLNPGRERRMPRAWGRRAGQRWPRVDALLRRLPRNLGYRPVPPVALSAAERAWLQAYYQPENARLAQFLGRESMDWPD